MQQDNNLNSLFKKSTVMDLLYHEINASMKADRTLDKVEKFLMNPEVLKTLTPDQLDKIADRKLRRIEESHRFIIDFYRVGSKSQEMQDALHRFSMLNNEPRLINGEVSSEAGNSPALDNATRAKLIDKIEKMFAEDDEQRYGDSNEG